MCLCVYKYNHAFIHIWTYLYHLWQYCFVLLLHQTKSTHAEHAGVCLPGSARSRARVCLDAGGPGCDSAEQWRLSGSGLRPTCKQHIKRFPLFKRSKTSRDQEHEIIAQESTHLSIRMSMEDPFFVVKGWVYGLDRTIYLGESELLAHSVSYD